MKNNILILLIADTFLLYSKFLAKNELFDESWPGCFFFLLFFSRDGSLESIDFVGRYIIYKVRVPLILISIV